MGAGNWWQHLQLLTSQQLEYVMLTMVAALGSVLGYVSRRWGEGKTLRLSRLVFCIFSSFFFLFLLKALADKLELDHEWTVILVGLCSWMGVEFTASLLERIVHRLLGVVPVYAKVDKTRNNCERVVAGTVYDMAALPEPETEAGTNPGDSSKS